MKFLSLSLKVFSVLAITLVANQATSDVHNSENEEPDPFIQEVHPNTGDNVTLEYQNTSGGYHWYSPVGTTPINSRNICIVKPSACQKDAL